ncbi:MAG: hypothetical protein ACFBWO_06010 [Paracoccaceae bacterium]
MDATGHSIRLIDNSTAEEIGALALALVPREGENLRLMEGVVERGGLYKVDVVVHVVSAQGDTHAQSAELYVSFVKPL